MPPRLPHEKPTIAAWQEPPHPTVANAQSATLPASADIVIIGSGITGCSVAHTLLNHASARNLRITMLEARTAVSGATGRNGGHLVSDSDSLFTALVPIIGRERSIETVRFSEANIWRLKELIAQLPDVEREAAEYRAVTATASYADKGCFKDAVGAIKELADAVPNMNLKCTASAAPSACQKYHYRDTNGVTQQCGVGALWPYRLLTAVLAQLLKEHGHRFTLETTTPVLSIEHNKSSTYPYAIETPRGPIRAKKIIHCTNAHAARLIPNLVGKLYPLKGTVSALKMGPSFPQMGDAVSWAHVGRGSYDGKTGHVKLGLYYAQQNARTGVVILGGESQQLGNLLSDDDSFVAPEAQASLLAAPGMIWKDAEPVTPLRVWSGLMGFTSDGFPLVGGLTRSMTGREGEGEWIAGGFNGHGMDKCWLSGEAVARMALGEEEVEGLPRAYVLDEERFGTFTPEMAAETMLEIIMLNGTAPKSHL